MRMHMPPARHFRLPHRLRQHPRRVRTLSGSRRDLKVSPSRPQGCGVCGPPWLAAGIIDFPNQFLHPSWLQTRGEALPVQSATMAQDISAICQSGAQGMADALQVLKADHIPVQLQEFVIDVSFTWSIDESVTDVAKGSIGILWFSASDTLTLNSSDKQTLKVQFKATFAPVPQTSTAKASGGTSGTGGG